MKKILFVTIAVLMLAGCDSSPISTPAGLPTEKIAPATVNTPDLIQVNNADAMVLIPEGEFKMGCDPNHNGGLSCLADELPLHTIKLADFYIDRFEVTNAQYSECVDNGACTSPINLSSETAKAYFNEPAYANHPVIYVPWVDADNYCRWAGKRLPTEAEWEKAARGISAKLYPWGEGVPTCKLANVYDASASGSCTGDTQAVGSYPDGASEYGVMDMAGNVWEWVNDWYSETYYASSPMDNPLGPSSGDYKVLRGGGWNSNGVFLRTSGRSYDPDFNNSKDVGFRCVSASGGN